MNTVQPLTDQDLPQIMAIERAAYAFPWSEGHFKDCFKSQYLIHGLRAADRQLLAYWVAMPGVEELHLLNLAVHPGHQHQGLAHQMLLALKQTARALKARQIWLEVRVSHLRTQAIYQRFGFEPISVRKGYYPADPLPREDGLVMRLPLSLAP
jgi:ribosomal-protein-alanine N-acetyltransferase